VTSQSCSVTVRGGASLPCRLLNTNGKNMKQEEKNKNIHTKK